MANVLPVAAQKKVWRNYLARFIIAFSLLMLALAVFAALLLIPSYFALRIPGVPAGGATTEHVDTGAADTVGIARAQMLMRTLSPLFTSTSSPERVIQSSLSNRPKGLSVEHITYTADQGQILLSGSGSRDAINAYRDTLAINPLFTSVSVPVAALVGNAGGNFSITLSGTF